MTVKAKFGPSYSRPLVVEFTAADFPGQLLLGKVGKDLYCPACVVEILTPFDAGLITVGDALAHGRFQASADNKPGVISQYSVEPNFAYTVATNAYVFLTGSPTVGRGRVILYLG